MDTRRIRGESKVKIGAVRQKVLGRQGRRRQLTLDCSHLHHLACRPLVPPDKRKDIQCTVKANGHILGDLVRLKVRSQSIHVPTMTSSAWLVHPIKTGTDDSHGQ